MKTKTHISKEEKHGIPAPHQLKENRENLPHIHIQRYAVLASTHPWKSVKNRLFKLWTQLFYSQVTWLPGPLYSILGTTVQKPADTGRVLGLRPREPNPHPDDLEMLRYVWLSRCHLSLFFSKAIAVWQFCINSEFFSACQITHSALTNSAGENLRNVHVSHVQKCFNKNA